MSERSQTPVLGSSTYYILLYLLVSTRAVIGQFSGPYSPVRPAKNLKLILLQNCFVIYRQLFLTFIASKNLKHFFLLNYVLKRANDLKMISN